VPTKRTRKQRQITGSCPADLVALFGCGTGWNHLDEDWIAEQWRQHGASYLDRHGRAQCLALIWLGEPGR
jgi:hypothetical protein